MLIPKTRKEIYQAYLSGDTHLELPKPVTRDEIILYNACINGAGTNPSWNDLTDKPFGVETETINLTWDGDEAGKETVDVSDLFEEEAYFVKLSNKAPEMGSVVSNKILSNFGADLSGSLLEQTGCYGVGSELVVVVTDFATSSLFGEVSFPSNGIWCSGSASSYVASISIETENFKPLDSKYIVLTSPNGTKYNLSVDDSGTLSATEAT